jgi:hypothetical protein
MSQRAIEFLESWIAGHVHPASEVDDPEREAGRLSILFMSLARSHGISDDEVFDAIGGIGLKQYMLRTMKRARP